MIIADNGGYDSSELVQDLKVEIEDGNVTMGLNLFEGKVDCMKTLGITVINILIIIILKGSFKS